MKRMIPLLTVLVLFLVSTRAGPPSLPPASSDRILLIDRSSTAVSGGKAMLSIGPLERTADIYTGDYQMKVSPYFFKGEKGRLAIVVTPQSLAKVANGIVAEVTGTATAAGKGGQTRRIDAIAKPVDKDHGQLKLWFVAEGRKMVFNTAYHFAEK